MLEERKGGCYGCYEGTLLQGSIFNEKKKKMGRHGGLVNGVVTAHSDFPPQSKSTRSGPSETVKNVPRHKW